MNKYTQWKGLSVGGHKTKWPPPDCGRGGLVLFIFVLLLTLPACASFSPKYIGVEESAPENEFVLIKANRSFWGNSSNLKAVDDQEIPKSGWNFDTPDVYLKPGCHKLVFRYNTRHRGSKRYVTYGDYVGEGMKVVSPGYRYGADYTKSNNFKTRYLELNTGRTYSVEELYEARFPAHRPINSCEADYGDRERD